MYSCVNMAAYGATTQPCCQFVPVATHSIATKKIPCGPKSIFPLDHHQHQPVMSSQCKVDGMGRWSQSSSFIMATLTCIVLRAVQCGGKPERAKNMKMFICDVLKRDVAVARVEKTRND